MENGKLIFHIDVNSAFLSWTAVKMLKEGSEVDLRQIPSIVGGDQEKRHGIVVAKSVPAKKYGIRTADTIQSAFARCPNLVMVQPEPELYREMSRTWKEFLSGFFPVMQSASIDEVYALFDPEEALFPDPLVMADHIRSRTFETFGFTVNVGISDVKVLAKMASDFEKPDRTHTLFAAEIREKMWPLPIEDLYMCGKSTASRFRTFAIKTIGDLARSDPRWVESIFKKHGSLLWRYANGLDESQVNPVREKAKGVGNSVTLPEDIVSRDKALEVLKKLAEKVSERLSKKGARAGSVCVEIKYSDFHSESHQGPLRTETDRAADIYRAAVLLFDTLWSGEPARLLGIRASGLTEPSEVRQLSLFDYAEEMRRDEKKRRLEEAVSGIKKKYGAEAIRRGMTRESPEK